ncbi:MAG: anaerobic carbon-monoxide dehydrogenase catalytic subunit [Candidatus Acididesulfobacter diazotrophicus]|uniref:Carbon monoxide dehydrogenase n=1 Tax=Candidatus Acididesulfobacter diazotrophicus TaxID=2597226 RepID=A0A519BLW1_9DELT|nr:MAG: anaerobic carbon-monoxide dehydrogenase catalytic subunit [Candidatus Acididesulfobacter diazotrophicus]
MSMKTFDAVTQSLINRAEAMGIETGINRLESQLPQCGFGQLGSCCRICYMGPCRIDPFGEGASKGVCGATADVIVCRNLLREEVGGAASHVGHARHVVLAFQKMLEGKAPGYKITDRNKLMDIALRLGIKTEDKSDIEIGKEVVGKALEDISNQNGEPMNWLKLSAQSREFEMWKEQGILISNAHNEIEEAMHRTSMGNDADPVNLLLACLKMGLVDGYAGLHMATDFHDILFGTPQITTVEANIGVLDKDKVNIAIHGHNPVLSEKILEWAFKMKEEAKKSGALDINVVGVCCTGNELTMRHGVPLAAHNLQSELVLITGAVDAMVVDMQCIWPSLAMIAECFHTKLITTEPFVKIPGAIHVPFDVEHADEEAKNIVMMAIDSFKERKGEDVHIPKEKSVGFVGFSVEAIVDMLKKIDSSDPLKPIVDNIVNGNIYGVVGFVGCPSIKLRDTFMTEKMTKELLKNNVLVVTTGCTAQICIQAGLMDSSATDKYCGEGLKTVLHALGKAAGFDVPLPPVWHMGSCVDNARIGTLLGALADRIGVKISQLPVAGSAPELVQEKAISIGTWFLALGLLVHIAPSPRILGSPVATNILTKDLENITGGKVYVELDPIKAAAGIISHIKHKRTELGI